MQTLEKFPLAASKHSHQFRRMYALRDASCSIVSCPSRHSFSTLVHENLSRASPLVLTVPKLVESRCLGVLLPPFTRHRQPPLYSPAAASNIPISRAIVVVSITGTVDVVVAAAVATSPGVRPSFPAVTVLMILMVLPFVPMMATQQ